MTIDFSEIRVDLQEHERWRRTLRFTVPPEVVSAEREATAAQLARRLKTPGFRKRKDPSAAIEKHHARAVERETLERLIGETYRRALEERGLQPITEAEIDEVVHHPGGPLTFRASFEIQPVIELARLGGFRVERPSARVDPGEVDMVLKHLVRENAIWRPPDRPGRARDGDLVTVQIVPLDGGSSSRGVGLPWARRLQLRSDTDHRGRYQFILGDGDAVADLESAVRALSPGESGEFTVRDDEGPLRLRITLENRRVPELPALDDAFARSLGDFADLASLRRKILEDLEAEASTRAESVLRERLLAHVMSANPFQAPASMVEEPAKRGLLLTAIAQSKGLVASEEEVAARIAEIASLGGVTPEEVRARLVQTQRLDGLARDITESKVFEFLLGQSQVVDEA